MSRALVAIRGVSQRFGADGAAVTALESIDLEIPDGQFAAVVGPSGCGKSTLLSLVAGLRLPSSGTVLCDGQPMTAPKPRKVGMIFQEANLLPWLSAVDNVAFPLKLRRVAKSERLAAARRMLPRKRGVVVSTASGTGIRGQPKGSAYSASKAGIIGFTRAVSLELKDTGVRINCFGPGATDTPLWRVGKTEEEIKRLLAAGYVYQPDDFSNVVVFLASDMSWPLNGEFISRDLHR